MKRITALILILVTSTLVFVSANEGQDKEATFAIDRMTCAACPITVSKAIKRVDGVKEVTVDFEVKTATVIYDASLTDAKHIADASSNVGFPASVLKDSSQ